MVHPTLSKHSNKVRLAQDATLWARREQRAVEALEGVRDGAKLSEQSILKLKSERDGCIKDLHCEKENVLRLEIKLRELQSSNSALVAKLDKAPAAMSLLAAPSDGMTRALQAERAKVGLLEKKVRLLEAEINERKQGLPRAPTWAGVAAEPPASVSTRTPTSTSKGDEATLEGLRNAVAGLQNQLRESDERLAESERWRNVHKSDAKARVANERELGVELGASEGRVEELKRSVASYESQQRAAAVKAAKGAQAHAREVESLKGRVASAERKRDEILERFAWPEDAIRSPAADDCLTRALGVSEDQLLACLDQWGLAFDSIVPRVLLGTLDDIKLFEDQIKAWRKDSEVELQECRTQLEAADKRLALLVFPPSVSQPRAKAEPALRKRIAELTGTVRILRVELDKRHSVAPSRKPQSSSSTQTDPIDQQPASPAQSIAMRRLAANVSSLNQVITNLRSENISLLLQLSGVRFHQ